MPHGRDDAGIVATCDGALLACAGACALRRAPAAAQGSYSQYDESPAAALARYVRTLASDPKDFASLIGAGKAALELGDAQAAAGFFARADEVNPHSPLPQAGMGAVSVANGDAAGGAALFRPRPATRRAGRRRFGCDRGLAYDLLGQQAQAQADYRAAIGGLDGDEARRRLALSLAISGDRAGALQTLAPLAAKGDPGVARVRAFVLALTGDSNAAMSAINAAMPGSSARVAPFIQRLPALPRAKSGGGQSRHLPGFRDASLTRSAPPSVGAAVNSVSTDRLADIDALLGAAAQPAEATPAPARPLATASSLTQRRRSGQRPAHAVSFQPKIWLQLASGSDVDALSDRFQRLKSHEPRPVRRNQALCREEPAGRGC